MRPVLRLGNQNAIAMPSGFFHKFSMGRCKRLPDAWSFGNPDGHPASISRSRVIAPGAVLMLQHRPDRCAASRKPDALTSLVRTQTVTPRAQHSRGSGDGVAEDAESGRDLVDKALGPGRKLPGTNSILGFIQAEGFPRLLRRLRPLPV